MNYPVSLPVGTDLVSLNPGFLVGGIRIDNPTNAWLLALNRYWIPPLTLQFATPIIPRSLSVDIRYQAAGPSGQASTLTGSPVIAWITDEILPYSRGQTYLTNP
jgi:hypothetical protein